MDSSSTLGLVISSGLMSCYKQKHTKLGIKKHKPKIMHSLARTRRCTAKPINLLCFHLSWPYFNFTNMQRTATYICIKRHDYKFHKLTIFSSELAIFWFYFQNFQKNTNHVCFTPNQNTQLHVTQTSVVVLCNQSPPIREDICMGYSKP